MSINDMERKLKEGLYSTKTKQGKSDIWRSFSMLCDKDGNKLDFVSCNKCPKYKKKLGPLHHFI